MDTGVAAGARITIGVSIPYKNPRAVWLVASSRALGRGAILHNFHTRYIWNVMSFYPRFEAAKRPPRLQWCKAEIHYGPPGA